MNTKGKFKALIDFRIDAGDVIVEEFICSCKRNATYISKTSQNDLLQCMSQYIQAQIIADVKHSKYYGILADEVTDVSDWEQLGVALRYVKDNVAHERLVEFVACESVTGNDICEYLLSTLQQLGLSPNNCRAQAYDGAGAMSGYINGCQAKFREKVPQALYYHCCSHQLNLVLSNASTVSSIQCMLSDLKALGIFFKYSPKRQRQLERSAECVNTARRDKGQSAISLLKIKTLCETRWVERHTALTDFYQMYEIIIHCLEAISINADNRWVSKAVTEASGLLRALTSDSFIVTFQTNMYFFGYTKGLSILLQGSHLDVTAAFGEVEAVKKELLSIRNNSEKEFSTLYQDMTAMAGKNELSVPRRCSMQTSRVNVQAESPEVYWRIAVFIPFLDSLLMELNNRFSSISRDSLLAYYLLPTNLSKLDEKSISQLKHTFHDDLPLPSDFNQEVRLWKRKWGEADNHDLPLKLADVLNVTNSKFFPNVYTILELLTIIPVTTATVERGNSALKYVKTKLRSTMTEERLNSLLRARDFCMISSHWFS